MSSQHAVVVGASLAGLRAAEQLRAAGHAGAITVLGAEQHLPYNRPPLSKEVLAGAEPATPAELAERLAFRRRRSVADVDFRLGDAVVAADLAQQTLRTASGSAVAYDGLVVATGLRPRWLDVPGPVVGRHVLRTVEDCHTLRTALARSGPATVVVVGAGFVGCEVASTLRRLGHEVTVVEPAGRPMERVLGPELAAAVQRHHESHGIRFRLGAGVTGFAGDERVEGVALTTGELLAADHVVEAVGSVCNVGWLAGGPLDLTDGVLTDNALAAVGAERVVAVGDVARFPNPLFDDEPRRVEHWSIPTDTAKRAAATLVALMRGERPDPEPFCPVPSFWSDQLDLRLQSFGSPALADEVAISEGDPDGLVDGVLATYRRDGRLVGRIAVNLTPARQRDLRNDLAALVPA
ncbi:NAD/ferredoxin-dependent reductase-like protein [Mumia flava]|uniref:NAD/ferredoxin-dependent reductase-like protein n=1 Tax=Mumia flava TaxID=1348852 RepID=A0A0B2BP02_9ACTN|nr:FAD-dependent oxidoreductase [Mumia flava]PJJ56576.1 NAD/ferredoxin-dependent reductase-like protein [Mumia flava]